MIISNLFSLLILISCNKNHESNNNFIDTTITKNRMDPLAFTNNGMLLYQFYNHQPGELIRYAIDFSNASNVIVEWQNTQQNLEKWRIINYKDKNDLFNWIYSNISENISYPYYNKKKIYLLSRNYTILSNIEQSLNRKVQEEHFYYLYYKYFYEYSIYRTDNKSQYPDAKSNFIHFLKKYPDSAYTPEVELNLIEIETAAFEYEGIAKLPIKKVELLNTFIQNHPDYSNIENVRYYIARLYNYISHCHHLTEVHKMKDEQREYYKKLALETFSELTNSTNSTIRKESVSYIKHLTQK